MSAIHGVAIGSEFGINEVGDARPPHPGSTEAHRSPTPLPRGERENGKLGAPFFSPSPPSSIVQSVELALPKNSKCNHAVGWAVPTCPMHCGGHSPPYIFWAQPAHPAILGQRRSSASRRAGINRLVPGSSASRGGGGRNHVRRSRRKMD